MAQLFEKDAVAKPQEWADLIANVESDATPFTSMIRKRKRPNQVLHYWQCKKYATTGHKGVLDGKDATEFHSNQGQELTGVAQKTWRNPGVSDFMEEVEVAGIKGSNMADQIADALVTVKRQIEKRALSNEDNARDDGVDQANETRGLLKWSDSSFASYGVPSDFQTPAGNKSTAGNLAAFTEAIFKTMGQGAYKERKGPAKAAGFVGVELKQSFTDFTTYTADKASHAQVRTFNQNASSRDLVNTVDRLVLDTGTYDLHLTSFLRTNASTGEDTAYTHKSGIFVDLDMCGLAYTRLPRVKRLDYQGGGHKAIVDAIFMLMVDNPLTMMPIHLNS